MSTVKAANLQNTGSGAPTFQNSSGTEIGQLTKVWVSFDGSGTISIGDSFNVSSITDNGSGDYTVNFSTALANANYALVVGCHDDSVSANNFAYMMKSNNNAYAGGTFYTTTSARNKFGYAGGSQVDDMGRCMIVIFGA